MSEPPPGAGDVILCVYAAEANDLRVRHPDAVLASPDSVRSLEGLRITGRIFTTARADERPFCHQAMQALKRSARKSGGDYETVHSIGGT
ncbi:hypothetical protein L3Q67_01015 [Saccharothrix sp. AJ9571]|nr:hypothetical protein L3Q67_01015 [Saccharothrix sp. AJ9571]